MGDLTQLWPLLGQKATSTAMTLEWFRLHFDSGAVVECKNDFRSPTLVQFYGFAKVQMPNAECYDTYPSNYICYRDRISEAGDGSYGEMARFLFQMQPGLREMLPTSVPFAKLLGILDAPVRIPEHEWTTATSSQQVDIAADEVMRRIRANFDPDQEELLAPLVEKARAALRKTRNNVDLQFILPHRQGGSWTLNPPLRGRMISKEEVAQSVFAYLETHHPGRTISPRTRLLEDLLMQSTDLAALRSHLERKFDFKADQMQWRDAVTAQNVIDLVMLRVATSPTKASK